MVYGFVMLEIRDFRFRVSEKFGFCCLNTHSRRADDNRVCVVLFLFFHDFSFGEIMYM